MQNIIGLATISGAGLSFPVACIMFFTLGQPYAFALLPAGALVGFGVGTFLKGRSDSDRTHQSSMLPEKPEAANPNWFGKITFPCQSCHPFDQPDSYWGGPQLTRLEQWEQSAVRSQPAKRHNNGQDL